MSQMGYVWTAPGWQGESSLCSIGRCSHVFVLFALPTATSRRKTLAFEIDYRQLLKEFQSRGTLVRASYYTAIFEDRDYLSIRPLIDWLDYNGYTVVTKAAKEFIDASGRRRVK